MTEAPILLLVVAPAPEDYFSARTLLAHIPNSRADVAQTLLRSWRDKGWVQKVPGATLWQRTSETFHQEGKAPSA